MWSTEEEDFSFMRSAPYSFSAHNGDGPNRVEIFDIMSLPSHHSAISETTCLCDIFGDDCESPAHSCSPASGFLSTMEVDDFSLPDDTNNDSSGSYHTAGCSEQLSDSSETFEDSKDTPEPTPSEMVPSNTSTCVTQSSESVYFPPQPTDPTLLPDVRVISLSSPAVSYKSRNIVHPPEMRNATPTLENRQTNHSPIHQITVHSINYNGISPPTKLQSTSPLLTPGSISPSSKPASPVTEVGTTCPSHVLQDLSVSPRPQVMSPSPKLAATYYSPTPQATPPSIEPGASFPSSEPMAAAPSPKPRAASSSHRPQILSSSLKSVIKNHAPLPQSTSPRPQVMPPLHNSQTTCHSPIPQSTSLSPQLQVISPSLKPATICHTTIPQAKSSSPRLEIMSLQTTTETICHSPILQAKSPSPRPQIMSVQPTPGTICYSSTPQGKSPSPRPQIMSLQPTPGTICHSPILQAKSPSPRPQIMALQPKPGTICHSTKPQAQSPSPRPQVMSFSPTLGTIQYPSLPQPSVELGASFSSSELTVISPSPKPEAETASLKPQVMSLSPKPSHSPILQNTFPLLRTEIMPSSSKSGMTCLLPTPQANSPSPRPQAMSLSPKPITICQSPITQATSPSPRPQVMVPLTKPETMCHSPIFRTVSPLPNHQVKSSSPIPGTLFLIPISRATSCSPITQATPSSLKVSSPSSNLETISRIPEPHAPLSSPKLKAKCPSTKPRTFSPSAKSEYTSSTYNPQNASPSPEPGCTSPTPKHQNMSPLPKPEGTSPTPKPQNTSHLPKPEGTPPTSKSQNTSPLPKLDSTSVLHKPQATSHSLIPATLSPKPVMTTHSDTTPVIITHSDTTLLSKSRDITPLSKTREESPSLIHSPVAVISTELNVSTNTSDLLFEPKKIHFLAKCRTLPLLPNYQGKNSSPEPKITNIIPEKSDTSTTLETNELSVSSCSEASGKNPSLKSCDMYESLTTLATDDGNQRERSYSPQSQFNSDTSVPITACGKPEKTESSNSPPVHEAAMSPKPASLPQNPVEVTVTSRGSPSTDKSSDHKSSEREGGVGEDSRGEDQMGKTGDGKQGEAGYREEQVELSFTAKNRKQPVSRSPPTADRQPQSGTPARCYSDCMSTRQRQHQNSVRPQHAQHKHQGGARKPQTPATAASVSASGFLPDRASANSSMGSELDEADNEVKWFTDLAFRSLSSPQVDYLDVYNSSHRSSTNVSQPSTEDSTGANAWSAYADLRGSARYDNEELSRQPPAAFPSEGLNRAKRFDVGSFECVDVAMESREEVRRGKRTVPKRQIQLKRHDTSESRSSLNSEAAVEGASMHRNSKDILLRQHSTPAAMQEDPYRGEPDSNPGHRKQKLQKSVSLDETSGKTKMASCHIKSVLSKKMKDEDKLASQQLPVKNGGFDAEQTMSRPTESPQSPFIKQTTKTEVSSLSSGLASDCSLSSEDLLQRAEPNQQGINKKHEHFSSSPHQRPVCESSFSSLPSGTGLSESQSNNEVKLGRNTDVAVPFESNKKDKHIPREERKQLANSSLVEKNSSDSASAIMGNTSIAASEVPTEQRRMTNRSPENSLKPGNYKQQNIRSLFKSRTPEITLKPCISGENKTALKVLSLSPDPEIISEQCPVTHQSENVGGNEVKLNKSEGENENLIGNDTNKGPVHKVRDVRKMVKNTYNLSFKAALFPAEDQVSPSQKRNSPTPVPLQIEFKAISRKADKTGATDDKGDNAGVSPPSQTPQEALRETALLCITPRSISAESTVVSESHDKLPGTETVKVNTLSLSESSMLVEEKQKENKDTPKMESTPDPPIRDREISTLILLQDGQNTDEQDPSAPPPLSLTTTSSSRSVSMLLKEKGFQADIGFCDTLNGNETAVPKHVNRLEVPLQMCPVEETSAGSQKKKVLDPMPSQIDNVGQKPAAEGELRQKDPPTPRNVDLENTSLRSPERETQSVTSNTQETAVSATSTYTQQESVTEETHTTSFIQKSTVMATSSSSDQPVVMVTSSIKQNPIPTSNPEQPKIASTQEQAMSGESSRQRQPAASAAIQALSYAKERAAGSPFQHPAQADRLRFYASDDPPSYDERESFSPLLLTDLPARRYHRYHPTCHVPPCSCTSEGLLSPAHSSLQPPNLAPPSVLPVRAQEPPHPAARPSVSQRENRSDSQPVSCQAGSPQPAQARMLQVPGQMPQLQHLTAVPPCPGPLPQPRSEESRQPPPGPRMDRQPARHRSPQQPAHLVGGSPYASHAHSPGVPSLETRPQYLCSPQGFPSPFGPEYGTEGSGGTGVLYPKSSGGLYGQSPRRVLLDPETGKYFYIEVPMQPLRKMLFDPETGHYVEVLIPQSGLYPPSAVSYPSLHSPSMYGTQYVPYSIPPQPPSQPPRHPEAPPAPPALHQNTTGFPSPGSQGPKAEPQNHPPLDQSYLESMYYIPTGMTASPNPTPPNLYHKLPPSSVGKRS